MKLRKKKLDKGAWKATATRIKKQRKMNYLSQWLARRFK